MEPMPAETIDRRKRFFTLYRANFGRDPFAAADQDQADIWFAFLDAVPAIRLDDLVAAVIGARGKARWHPGLEDFKRAWMGITGQNVGRGAPTSYCPHCIAGQLYVLGYVDAGRFVLADQAVPGHEPWRSGGEALLATMVPCACAAGLKAIGRDANPAAIKAVDWIVAKKREWGLAGIDPQGWMIAVDRRLKAARDFGRAHA